MHFTREELVLIYGVVDMAAYNEEKDYNKLINESEDTYGHVNAVSRCGKRLDALKSLKKKVKLFRDNYEIL